MNRMQRVFGVLVFQILTVGIPLFVGSTHLANAAEVRACQSAPGALDRRLVAKAAEGDDSLRRFLQRTEAIYGLTMDQARARVERVRRDSAACEVAQGSPAQQP